MAVTNIKNSTALLIRFEKGQNLDGSPKVASQKFSRINSVATDQELFTLGAAIGAVLISEPVELRKIDDFTLVSE